MSWLKENLKDERFAAAYAEEAFVEDVINSILEWLAHEKISRAELAVRLGLSRPSITNFLKRKNLTLRTLARVVRAMDAEPHFAIRSRRMEVELQAPEKWSYTKADGGYELTGFAA
jgi:ParB-like chromosome segregation protein Spo0J